MRSSAISAAAVLIIAISSVQAIEISCSVAPTSENKSSWCSICPSMNPTALSCSSCSTTAIYLVGTGMNKKCSENDCSASLSTFTTSWCTDCNTQNQTASADGKKCLNIDCSSKPASGSYSDDWCNACAASSAKALSDKTGCEKGNNLSSSGKILSMISVAIILLASL